MLIIFHFPVASRYILYLPVYVSEEVTISILTLALSEIFEGFFGGITFILSSLNSTNVLA